jgi:hypothetical protein
MKDRKVRVLSWMLFFVVSTAAGQLEAAELYTLLPGSTFQQGCSGPCLCPIEIEQELTGTFTLFPTGVDPLFTNYSLEGISWTAEGPNGQPAHTITGGGTYRLGGEVAVMHQLTLDLSIDGGEPTHFDSGLVVGGSEFPTISISANRGAVCFNMWIDILAAPAEEQVPTASLEYPINGQTVSGLLPIYGFAVDEKGIAKLELLIDDEVIGNIPYGGSRADIKKTHPGFPDAENSGFAMVWNFSSLTPGDHLLKIRIYNGENQTKELQARVTVKVFHGEYVDRMTPGRAVLRNQSVTVDGVTKRYNIQLKWSEILQNFEISDIIPK